EQGLAQHRQDRELAVVYRPLQAGDALGADLRDQLRADVQAGLGGQARTRGDLHRRTQLTHQRTAGRLVQGDGGDLVAGGDPGTEEVVLQHRDPAVARLLVHAAVLEVVLVELATLVAAVIPGRAVEAEGLRAGVAALDHRRLAHQLAVHLALPRCRTGVDHLVADLHRVFAAGQGEGAADLHAVLALPHE